METCKIVFSREFDFLETNLALKKLVFNWLGSKIICLCIIVVCIIVYNFFSFYALVSGTG